MSAASPKVPETAKASPAHEPSMEEILASIRRIIADDQDGKPSEEAAPQPAPRPVNDDVLDLAEVAQPVRRPQPVSFDPPEIDFGPVVAEIPATAPRTAPERLQAAVEEAAVERLVSKATDESVGQAFHLLAHTVLTNNARTLEDLVKDMLRPMLKAWLDDNLPSMVERLVRAEIERVARGR